MSTQTKHKANYLIRSIIFRMLKTWKPLGLLH